MASHITYIRIMTRKGEIIGGDYKNLIKRPDYTAFTPDMLFHVKCLPDNIRNRMRIISSPVQVPAAPLETALGKILPDTRVSCSNYGTKNVPKHFAEAMGIFAEHLKDQNAYIGVSLAAAVDLSGKASPGAQMQLNFFKLSGGGSMDLSKGSIHVDLENMYLFSKWTKEKS
jgi:hypothetical protein